MLLFGFGSLPALTHRVSVVLPMPSFLASSVPLMYLLPVTERSRLAPAAQPLQDFIDRLLYAMAGLSEQERLGLEARLATML